MTERIMTILVAEDDDGHAELIQDHLQEAGIRNPIIRFQDGQEVWEYLSCTGPGPHRQPDTEYLLLLDIRMPRMDGIEVLRRVKASPELQHIPVMMLTTTDTPHEIEECYRLGCNFYVAKPVAFSGFSETLRRLGLFLMVVRVSGAS